MWVEHVSLTAIFLPAFEVGAALGCVPRGDRCVHRDDPEDSFEIDILKAINHDR